MCGSQYSVAAELGLKGGAEERGDGCGRPGSEQSKGHIDQVLLCSRHVVRQLPLASRHDAGDRESQWSLPMASADARRI